MEVLEAYDLTKSYQSAAQLAGVDHHTVARLVTARGLGAELGDEPALRSKVPRPLPTRSRVDRAVLRSGASRRRPRQVGGHGLPGLGGHDPAGGGGAQAAYHHDRHRTYKPWITEPGAWLQYDFGAGRVIDGVAVILFCAWLAWSRFRVIVPLGDRTLPSVIAALDRTFRLVGGAPTYVLIDNERTVTYRHIAGIAVRNQAAVDVSRCYGVTIATGVPFDPESKAWATDCTAWLDGRTRRRPRGDRDHPLRRTGPILPLAGEPRRRRCDRRCWSCCLPFQ